MSKTVTVTGAAGAIGYAVLFRIASGQLLGPDEKVRLRLLEIEPALKAAEGTAMELVDCAFPLLEAIDITSDANEAFDGANIGLLIGARPRTKGMERADLLEANGAIFKPQGEAINAHAADDIKVLVVGNPANTNALITQSNAPDVPAERFTAMTRLDQNRAYAQLANKLDVSVTDIEDLVVWGNHSPTMFPDLFNAKVKGKAAVEVVDDMAWYENEYLPNVGKRGAAIIEARGASSAASAANAAIDHVHDWVLAPTASCSMAVPSDGSYGVDEGIISSFPVRASGGSYEIVQGLEVGDFAQSKIDITVGERPRSATPSPSWPRLARAPRSRARRPPRGRRASRTLPPLRSGADATAQAAVLGYQPRPCFSPCRPGPGRGARGTGSSADPHLLGDLGDRDAGLLAHDLQRLVAARAGAAWASAAAPAALALGIGPVPRPDGGVAAAPASAFAAASRRWNSSTCGRNSSMRASISRLFSSRKSATSRPVCHVCIGSHLPVTDSVTQQMSRLGGLDQSLQRGERRVRLVHGNAAHDGLGGDGAIGPNGVWNSLR